MRAIHSFTLDADQRGTALVMTLVFLLLLTILGITAMGTSNLQEKLAGNTKDMNLAFQSAETALVSAENWLKGQLTKPTFPDNAKGLYVASLGATEVWESVTWSGSNLVTYPGVPGTPATGTLGQVRTMPKYVIEDLGEMPEQGGSLVLPGNYKGKGNTLFRITARGTGGSDNAVAILQSTYSQKF